MEDLVLIGGTIALLTPEPHGTMINVEIVVGAMEKVTSGATLIKVGNIALQHMVRVPNLAMRVFMQEQEC